MYYQRLNLDDFGVFQGARMNDIESGLVVIAGPQRAGKTTFMEALRRLGYGIGQGDDIPPESDTYRLDAQFLHDDVSYRLSVTGYGEPTLTPVDPAPGDEQIPAVEDVFAGLSPEQYRQLYTLSLYQLQRIPPSIDDPEDLSRVLLGAAYGSIADLPKVKQHFDGIAKDIGGKNGHPRYKQFSDSFKRIQDGEDELDEANQQVERHNEKQEELEEVEQEIAEITIEADELKLERQRLNTVQQYYDDFLKYRQLDDVVDDFDTERVVAYPENGHERAVNLQEAFENARTDASEAREAFVEETTADDPADRRDELLAIGEDLLTYQNEVSGWRERLRGIRETDQDLDNRKQSLESRVGQLREAWDEDLDAAKAVETDLVNRDTVERAVEAVTDAQDQVKELESELSGKRKRYTKLESQLEDVEGESGSQSSLLLVAGAGLLGIFAAIGIATLVNPIVGIVAGGVLLIAGTALGIYLNGDSSSDGSQRNQLQAQKNTVEQDIADLEERYDSATDTLEDAQVELQSVRETLGVEEDLSPAGVLEFYESVAELQQDIRKYESDVEDHHQQRAELADELSNIAEAVKGVQTFDWDADSPLEYASALFDAVEQAAAEYELANKWDVALTNQNTVQEEILDFLDQWEIVDDEIKPLELDDDRGFETSLRVVIDEGEEIQTYREQCEERDEIRQDIQTRFGTDAVREAFAASFDPPDDAALEEWYLDAFEDVAGQFADASEIERRLNEIDRREAELDDEREGLQEERAELKQTLRELASEEDLLAAREKIQEGEQSIERLAEQYATYRIAKYISEELQDQFIEETTGPLLEEASEIFARITTEYDGVEQTGELDNLDFQVIQNGKPVLESSELSRATAEQLFLAVRMARIRQQESSLPVVLDDSLTNFDPAHSARTMQLLDELATTNQVFFLTAHPAFVELAGDHADVDQYWRVDSGKFSGPFTDSEPAIEDLHPDPVPGRIDESA